MDLNSIVKTALCYHAFIHIRQVVWHVARSNIKMINSNFSSQGSIETYIGNNKPVADSYIHSKNIECPSPFKIMQKNRLEGTIYPTVAHASLRNSKIGINISTLTILTNCH